MQSRPGQENRQFHPACYGLGLTEVLPSLPLGFEPRHPVTQKANHALLGALVQTFAPERDPFVMSFDETLWNDV